MAVCFVVQARVKPGREEDFLQRYDALRRRLAEGVDAHIVHQLGQSLDDPNQWMIASYWEDYDASQEWERSREHHDLTMPMRDCWEEVQRSRYEIRSETRRGSA